MERVASFRTWTPWHKEQDEALILCLKERMNRRAIALVLKKTPAAIMSRRVVLLEPYFCMKTYMTRYRNPHKLPTSGTGFRVSFHGSIDRVMEIARKCGVK